MMHAMLKRNGLIFSGVLLPLFFFLCLGLLPADARAAAMPNSVRLNSIMDKVGQPSAVAVDLEGRLYIAHPGADRLEVLSRGGLPIHTIAGLAEPVSIAAGLDGTFYIGNKERGNVEVYGPDFQLTGKLGQGDGEFAEPHDITLDPAGNIYVADKKKHVVRKYNAKGKYRATIGSPGNGDGELHYPLSVAVDAATREIVVLDMKEVSNTLYYTSTKINGARIQFFDLGTGKFLRGYELTGTVLASSDLMRPVRLTVDGLSRLYVTDASFEEIKVLDRTCNFLGVVNDDDLPLSTPLGIALGTDKRLYVVSHNANRLDVFNLEDVTSLQADPLAASFTVNYGVLEAATQSIAMTNDGTTDLSWAAETSHAWITLSATGGFLQASQAMTLDLGVQPAGLGIGTYQGTVTISAAGVEKVVNVTLKIVPNYNLVVTPTPLSFESEVPTAPLFQSLAIENLGTGLLQWQAASDQDWLVLSGTTGAAPSGVQVFADVSALAAGNYTGNIVVSVLGESNVGPVTIPVSLTLHEAPPVDPPPEPPSPPGSGWPGDEKMVWKVDYQLAGTSLHSIWGSSGQNIFVVGDSGTILHFNGISWESVASGGGEALYGVWGSSATDVFAVGANGLIQHFNGTGWRRIDTGLPATVLSGVWRNTGSRAYVSGSEVSILSSPAESPWQIMLQQPNYSDFRGIWGSSDANIFAVGEYGTIFRYDGAAWRPMASGTVNTLYGIWGSSAEDIFAVGDQGTILHFAGSEWTPVDSGTTEKLKGIWGNSANEVYAVGENGTLLRYDGAAWIPVQAGTDELLNDVWSGRRNDIYAVSAEGSIIHGYAGFPWVLLQPALDYNAKQGQLRGQTQLNGAK
jgi:hypothetical protein